MARKQATPAPRRSRGHQADVATVEAIDQVVVAQAAANNNHGGGETPGTFEYPVCPRCGTLIIDHFQGRVNVGCPDTAIAGAMAGNSVILRPTNDRRRVATAQGDQPVPGIPTRTTTRVAGAGGRNAVVYVVANTRKRWDAASIEADQGMTPREKQMFRYVVAMAGKGGAIESQSNVDLGPNSNLLKRFGVDTPFTNKACESALYGLKAKGYINPVAAR